MGIDATAWEPFRLSDSELDRLLEDDLRFGDMTVRAMGIGAAAGRMTFSAREDLVLCGIEEASRLLLRLGASVSAAVETGRACAPTTLLLEAEGPAGALHAGWKTAQTLMEWASGIATATRAIVTAARDVAPRIGVLGTRKSVPLSKPLSIKAVMAGGADMHRLGLSDSVMVFPEHRAFLPPGASLEDIAADLRDRLPDKAIMIEVDTAADAMAAAEAGFDVIQLEKFSPAEAEAVVRDIRNWRGGNARRPTVAAAGGINAGNAAAYARTGVDALVTSAPFYAKPRDIQVDMRGG